MSRRRTFWLVAIVLVLALGFAVTRAVLNKRAQQQAVTQSAAKAQAVIELAPTDVLKVQERELQQTLAISGTLKAANSAVVKARVAGELQGLTVREGDVVKAGQVIARVEPTEYLARVKQAQQQADSAASQIEIAQRQWTNNKALVDQGFISKTALDTSWNNLTAAQANHRAALAAVDVAKKSLEDTVLRAPISGLVSQRVAQPGERVGVDAKVVEVVDLSRIELEATLGAADSVDVRVGQQATLQVEGTGKPIAAKVVRISPTAQAGSRSVVAYLEVPEPAGLRNGLFAQGTLAVGRTTAAAIPLEAIRTDKPVPYVQLVENDRVVHKSVEMGARGQSGTETLVAIRGVAPGASVIKGSLGTLREGTAVKFTGAPSQPAPATPKAPSP